MRVKLYILAVLLATPVWASQGKPTVRPPTMISDKVVPRSPVTIEDLTRINEEIAVLTAELKRLELLAQIAAKRAEMNKAGSGAPTPAAPLSAPLPAPAAPLVPPPMPPGMLGMEMPSEPAMPVVRGLEGVDGRLSATLVYPSGLVLTVVEGDTILDGWRIERITERSVTVVKDKVLRQLAFGRGSPANWQDRAPVSGSFPFSPSLR